MDIKEQEFIEDVMMQCVEEKWGTGAARVICPITDPFVKHHGALGSFVRVHLADSTKTAEILDYCMKLPQVEIALVGKTAAETFEMPLDREGDFIVIARQNAVIGSRADEHDLSNISGHRLRSHGGLSEQDIPLILSVPAKETSLSRRWWRNFDIFHLALNEVL